ncbi:YihY/virulence factor BrkB family protein [Clostridium tetani]|uniref:Ribonuclease BN n=1 Tax=Clostridium tetani (strain Massachusetts / E88) TaxID=212717 RepID=Q890W3_CLOTE|nr:ribonuclease BN [Clostridium tetani E88]AVP54649.1 YihY/virulence factor BrkB family protein [Clostridium tetani]KGI36752.1 ribonuclease BN [Clostridium tetani ATCC 9441]KGI38673.1 ribonuclease BN [Clostridium tetani]KGI43274.1 ribonuclease BN [Clostridium tetani]
MILLKDRVTVDKKNIINKIIEDEVPALASQLSYSLLLSFFPFLIFLMTLLGFSSIDNEYVLLELKTMLPDSAYELVYNTVIEILGTRDSNLLSFSIIFTVWTSSTGFRAVIKGINKAYDEKEKRSLPKVFLISILSTLSLGFLIILTVLFLVFGQLIGLYLVQKLKMGSLFYLTWNIIRYIIILSSLVVIFALMYKFIPSRKLRWREVMPGAIFATVGWLFSSFIFSYYVNNFANYSRIYGSIGAVIILMVWLYLTSIIIILGGELNAFISIHESIKIRARE